MNHIHLRAGRVSVIPITVGIILPYLATYLDALLPELQLNTLRLPGVPVFIAGFMLAMSSVRLIYTQEQWEEGPTPTGVPQHLVVSGPYRYVRNPMLLGMQLIICGEGLYFLSPGIFVYLAAFFLFLNLIMVPGEERRLEERFGESYTRYKSKIHRWLPTTSPYEDNEKA